MADLKYMVIQVETHFDGSAETMKLWTASDGVVDALTAETRFEKNMGSGIDDAKKNKSILNVALASDGTEVPECNEFYSRVQQGGPDDIIKYYHLMYITKKDGTADSVDLKVYTNIEAAEDAYHTKMGAALANSNTKTALTKIYNSHGGSVKMKYRDLDPEPVPPTPNTEGGE